MGLRLFGISHPTHMQNQLLTYLTGLLAAITGLFGRLSAATKSSLEKDVTIRNMSNQLAEFKRQMDTQNVDEEALKAQVAQFKAASDAAIERSNQLQAANDGALAKAKEIGALITADPDVNITVDPDTLVHSVDGVSAAPVDAPPPAPEEPAGDKVPDPALVSSTTSEPGLVTSPPIRTPDQSPEDAAAALASQSAE